MLRKGVDALDICAGVTNCFQIPCPDLFGISGPITPMISLDRAVSSMQLLPVDVSRDMLLVNFARRAQVTESATLCSHVYKSDQTIRQQKSML